MEMSFWFASLLKPLQFYIIIIHKQRGASFNFMVGIIPSGFQHHHTTDPDKTIPGQLLCIS